MARYLVFNIVTVTSKTSGEKLDIVTAISELVAVGTSQREIAWFPGFQAAARLFPQGVGWYEVDIIADGRGTRPVSTRYLGPVSVPDGAVDTSSDAARAAIRRAG